MVQLQVQAGLPILDKLPMNMGKIIRTQLDTQTISNLLTKQQSTLPTTTLFNNIDSIQSLAQKGFWQVSNL
ncbi:MAG: hypothetical protein WCK88_06985 [bacterium]